MLNNCLYLQKNNMQFNYIQYLWSEYTEEELVAIINGQGLESDKLRAKQELNKRIQEQTEFLEL